MPQEKWHHAGALEPDGFSHWQLGECDCSPEVLIEISECEWGNSAGVLNYLESYEQAASSS